MNITKIYENDLTRIMFGNKRRSAKFAFIVVHLLIYLKKAYLPSIPVRLVKNKPQARNNIYHRLQQYPKHSQHWSSESNTSIPVQISPDL